MYTQNLKTLFLLALFAAIFSSCNFNNNGEGTAENTTEQPAQTTAENETPGEDESIIAQTDTVVTNVDSFKIYCDQMMRASVSLPPVYQHEIFEENSEATDKFSKLSKASNGRMKIVVNSSCVVDEMTATIKSASVAESDMIILVDRTYSMYDHVEQVKQGINQIIDTLKKYRGTRLAIATYADKNSDGPNWFSFKTFGTDYTAAARYIQDVKVEGGGDWPESVYDAVMQCLQSGFWQSKKKCSIILVGDAPPLEKPLCNYTLDDVISASRAQKVRMNFYPILILPDIKKVRLLKEDISKYEKVSGNTTLYPNPCKGILTMTMEKTSTYYIEIYNMDGNVVVNDEHFGIIWKKDISHLPNGVYIARVISSDHTFELYRFILQH